MKIKWLYILGILGFILGLKDGYDLGLIVIPEYLGYATPKALVFITLGFIVDIVIHFVKK